MRSRMLAASALTIVLATAVTRQTASATLGQDQSARTAVDFRWQGQVAQGSTLEVKGVNGDITAQPGAGSQVEVVVVRRGRRSDPEDVKIEVIEHGGGTTICAVYPSKRQGPPNECRPGREGRMNTDNNDVNVKFTIRVPAGVRFVGRTVNGDVEAESLSGPVDVGTVNGSVTFSTTSYGEASTVNGSIKAAMGSTDWTDVLDFSTVNGSITIDLPTNLSTEVRARSLNGEISTDFQMTVTGRVNPQRLDGTIGAGGRSLELNTVNGSVRLRKR